MTMTYRLATQEQTVLSTFLKIHRGILMLALAVTVSMTADNKHPRLITDSVMETP